MKSLLYVEADLDYCANLFSRDNAFSSTRKGANVTISNNGLTASKPTATGDYQNAFAISPREGDFSFKVVITDFAFFPGVGVGNASQSIADGAFLGLSANSIGVYSNGDIFNQGVNLGAGAGPTFTEGDTIEVVVINSQFKYRVNDGDYSISVDISGLGTRLFPGVTVNDFDVVTMTGVCQAACGLAVADTWNSANKGANIALSASVRGADQIATKSASAGVYQNVYSVASAVLPFHCQFVFLTGVTDGGVGIGNSARSVADGDYLGIDSNSVGIYGNGDVYINNVVVYSGPTFDDGDRIDLMVDANGLRWSVNFGTPSDYVDISALGDGPFWAGAELGDGDSIWMLSGTGTKKCFNSLRTCQDRVNFDNEPVTLRFAKPASYLPKHIEAIPSITDVSFNPSTVSIGENLGQRATVSIGFEDHRHSDTGVGGDKYVAERSYDAYRQGTFWGKFRARFPFVQGRSIRVIRGTVGQDLEEMDVRHYVLESFSGPTSDGKFTLTAKDVLKLADDDRSQAPALSNGQLVGDITESSTSLQLSPLGIGDEEYDAEGYASIGGSEIVKYARDGGLDSFTSLLLHGEGTDAGTVFTDSSASALVPTAGGNVQTDTAQFKFGSSSILFDSSGDYLQYNGQSAFVFGSDDFAIDFWVRFSTLTGVDSIFDGRVSTGAAGELLIRRQDVTSKIEVVVNTTIVLTSASAMVVDTWTHIMLSREDGTMRLFINGVLEVSATVATSLIMPANRPRIGADSAAASSLGGWIDEFRVSKGTSRGFTDDFAVPAAAYASTSSDVLRILRAKFNTEAADHSAQDRVQKCLIYSQVTPADIIYDLLTNYASIDPDFIIKDSWDLEVATYLQRVYSACIAEPVGVNKLISELVEQAALIVWWDDASQLIRLQVVRQILSESTLLSPDNYIEGTYSVAEQPDKRLSQIWIYFGQINPLSSIEEPKNYRSCVLTIDLQAQSDYASPAIKKVFSRWIAQFGRTVAEKVGELIIARYKDPPRRVQFSTWAQGPELIRQGAGFLLTAQGLQTDEGEQTTMPIQITRLNPGADFYQVEAEEVLAEPFDAADLLDRVIVIDVNTLNFNLRDAHDALFPEITDPYGLTLTCVIEAGVIVGSSVAGLSQGSGSNIGPDTDLKNAFEVGDWPVGLPITIRIEGRIQGSGGAGGYITSTDSFDGTKGGTALYTRYPIDLINNGELWGGGGGGGGGFPPGSTLRPGGPGAGTQVRPKVNNDTGTDPTDTTGGSGRSPGSPGGGPGLDGTDGTGFNFSFGGDAGTAIDGDSYVSILTTGDIRGPQIN